MMTPTLTALDEILPIARANGVSPNGFTEGHHPRDGDEHPYGTPEDWLQPDDWTTQVGFCRTWIRRQNVIKSVNQRIDSYGYKHKVERECSHYICNGAFIVAAYMEGITVARDGPRSPNAVFNIGRHLRNVEGL